MFTPALMQALVFFGLILVLTRPVGLLLFKVFEGQWPAPGSRVARLEQGLYRLCGIDAAREQRWDEYARAVLVFSLVTQLLTYGVLRLQHLLPLNPQGLPAVDPETAFETAASFASNTNWQSYVPETTMSPLSQMLALTPQNFLSAAVGLAVGIALARGLTRKADAAVSGTIGNFWIDCLRASLYVLLPLSSAMALVYVGLGIVQTFSGSVTVETLEGPEQVLALGPVASQEAIKLLGTNGGGFFNANSAHPLEGPTPLSNLLSMVLIFLIPAGLTNTFGRMARDTRQGWALFISMAVLFLAGVAVCTWAEAQGNPAMVGLGLDQSLGNLEGKEMRFGTAASALFATVTTAASCGAVNAMHDSFTPLGGMVPLVNILMGEVIFGGVGAGLYGMLLIALLTVFLAGLMVGRTPEYLGKKIEVREITLVTLTVLIIPLLILGGTAAAVVLPETEKALGNGGPHGLSELLYAYTSAAGNNGSAFAGLTATARWFHITLGFAMLAGRYLILVTVLAIAGAMVRKKTVAPGPGTFPTNGLLFASLLVAVVVVVGALTYFPALALGPIVEHTLASSGEVF